MSADDLFDDLIPEDYEPTDADLEAAVARSTETTLARGELPPVRFSDLKYMGVSAAHYAYRLRTKDRARKRALDVGTVAHGLILGSGPDVIVYEGVRNARHKAYQAFLEEHPGALILNPGEYAAAKGIAQAVERCRAAVELLEGAHEQELATWEIAGRRCGGRPDVLHRDRVVELKTSVTSEPERFTRLGLRMAYPGQLAWYIDGAKATDGRSRGAYVIAAESAAPHVVTPMELSPRALDLGRRTARLWFERLLVCEETDEWPGYVTGVVPFDVAPESDDFDLEFGEENAA